MTNTHHTDGGSTARHPGRAVAALAMLGLALAGCAKSPLPAGEAAYQTFPPPTNDATVANYEIGALDTIGVTVFQEPDLTASNVQVDAAGNILLPLIGEVKAADKTSTQLADEIAQRLKQRYLTNPQVSVIVQDSVSQHVTVNGSVTEPGVYAIKGRTTLLDAIAMAKGTSRVASLGDVAVFRMVNGQRIGGVFNVSKISRGEAPDPEIVGNDTIVVGLSNVKAAWRDLLTASPLIAAFRYY
jgi:polysaccharide biosynthesis/export protein